jgi:hypothetical protein
MGFCNRPRCEDGVSAPQHAKRPLAGASDGIRCQTGGAQQPRWKHDWLTNRVPVIHSLGPIRMHLPTYAALYVFSYLRTWSTLGMLRSQRNHVRYKDQWTFTWTTTYLSTTHMALPPAGFPNRRHDATVGASKVHSGHALTPNQTRADKIVEHAQGNGGTANCKALTSRCRPAYT